MERRKGKEKRLVKHTTKLAETLLVSDLKRQLAKQASSIDQLTKSLKPLEKYHYNYRKTVQDNQAD